MCGNLSNVFGEKSIEKLVSSIYIICDIKEMTLEFHECQVNGKNISVAE